MKRISAKMNDSNSPLSELGRLKYVASIVKEVGIPAFLVACFVLYILIFATFAQKRAIIDTWVLFKPSQECNCNIQIAVTAALAVLLVGFNIYYYKLIGLKNREIKRIGTEKSELHAISLLNKNLGSSES